MVNKLLFPWISDNSYGRIISMPANSGRHESEILSRIGDNVGMKLFTCDRDFESYETGIKPHSAWGEHHVGDIFRWLMTNSMSQAPTAIWFDLCGGLTESNMTGIKGAVMKLCGPRSLLFVTLCVHGVRGLDKQSLTGELYKCTVNPTTRADITEQIMLVHIRPFKQIKALREPYIYKRNSATFAVFFFSLN
jgi:hypothetical protein